MDRKVAVHAQVASDSLYSVTSYLDWDKNGEYQVCVMLCLMFVHLSLEWFVENFPTQMTLDGELWGGINTFKQTQSLVRKIRTDDTEWKRMVFKGNQQQQHITDRKKCLMHHLWVINYSKSANRC